MLLPLGDDNSDRHLTPIINYLLIALNIFVFIYWQQFGRDIGFTFAYSTVPAEIFSGQDIVTIQKIHLYTGNRKRKAFKTFLYTISPNKKSRNKMQ